MDIITDFHESVNVSALVNQNETQEDMSEDVLYVDNVFYTLWHGVVLVPLCLLGVIGNIMSSIVLSRPRMKSSANTMLIALAICDTIVVIVLFLLALDDITTYIGTVPEYVHNMMCAFPWLMHIGRTARTASVYITIGVTIERYHVVCWPLQAKEIWTRRKNFMALLIITIFTIVSTIPEYLRVSIRKKSWSYYEIKTT